jgi:hypothetical protein
LVSEVVVVVPPGVETVSVVSLFFDSSPQPTRPAAGNERRPRIRANDRGRFMDSSLLKPRIVGVRAAPRWIHPLPDATGISLMRDHRLAGPPRPVDPKIQ